MKRQIQISLRTAFALLLIAAAVNIISCSDSTENPIVDDGVDRTAPATPVNLGFLSVGNGGVHIRWDENTELDLAGYKLYRAEFTDSPENYIMIADTTGTDYKDNNLNYTTNYFYRVSAYDNNENESAKSEALMGIPQNTQSPNMPTGLSVFAYNFDHPYFRLTWLANTEFDLAGYKIYRGTDYNYINTLIDSTASIFYEDTLVYVDTTYLYKITAYDKGGWESPATQPEYDVALHPPVLTSPVNSATTSATPTLTWEFVTNTVQYKIFVQTSPQAGEIWVQTVDNTQNSIIYDGATTLQSGTTYYWKVATITKDAEGLNSVSLPQAFIVQ